MLWEQVIQLAGRTLVKLLLPFGGGLIRITSQSLLRPTVQQKLQDLVRIKALQASTGKPGRRGPWMY